MLLDLKDQIYRFLEQACWWAKVSWYCCVTNWMGYCLMIIYQWLGLGYPEIANVFFAISWNLRSSTSWPEESPHRGRRRSHIFRGMFDALGLDSSWWNYTPICTRMFVACMIFMFLPLRFKEKRHKVPPMDHIFRINGSIVVTTGPQHIFPKDPLNRFKPTQIADFL
jgi:hypothetical protein